METGRPISVQEQVAGGVINAVMLQPVRPPRHQPPCARRVAQGHEPQVVGPPGQHAPVQPRARLQQVRRQHHLCAGVQRRLQLHHGAGHMDIRVHVNDGRTGEARHEPAEQQRLDRGAQLRDVVALRHAPDPVIVQARQVHDLKPQLRRVEPGLQVAQAQHEARAGMVLQQRVVQHAGVGDEVARRDREHHPRRHRASTSR